MKLRGLVLFVCVAFCLPAFAQPAPQMRRMPVPPTQPAQVWDSRGWVMLGETTVNGRGRLDSDRVVVGRQEGKFSKLTLVVENGDLEMVDFAVEFGNGQPWRPGVSQFFREGTRTRVIDIPDNQWDSGRTIKSLFFSYRNISAGGHARVQVWAWRTGDAMTPPAPVFDSRGWVPLGERDVNGHGRLDRDRIDVGRQEGRFSKLTLVVENADLELVDFTILFNRGEGYRPNVAGFFRDGTRTRVIELPPTVWGNEGRTIQAIELSYRNIPGGRHAKVAVFGFRDETPPPAPVYNTGFDSRGWVMLGEREVHGHGRENRDRIDVGRQEGKFSKLTLVVMDSDLELFDMAVQFRKGDPWHPATKHFFKEGARARLIELPPSQYGNGERTIQYIDLSYRNLPGEGHARVQVWAQ